MIDAESIRGVELFQGLGGNDLSQIFSLAQEMDYPAGERIVAENTPGGRLHIILSGSVEVRKKSGEDAERVLAVLGQGTVFGEMSVFDGHPYSAGIVAKTPTHTLSLVRSDFLLLGEKNPGLALKITMNLIKMLSAKLRKTNENLIALTLLLHGNG